MSLDTRNRRAAAAAAAVLWLVAPPLPDGDVSSLEDRRHLAGLVRVVSSVAAGPAEARVTLRERGAAWMRERRRPALTERRAVWLREETR